MMTNCNEVSIYTALNLCRSALIVCKTNCADYDSDVKYNFLHFTTINIIDPGRHKVFMAWLLINGSHDKKNDCDKMSQTRANVRIDFLSTQI